ncbi:unnamed protein product [Brachionus calyciflorus]|uniref:Uncharacterized protein n=1 Tax=Brachionus calyciflorus TaxID=104777 RepID=A0A813S7V1_9BILA|nr:unnamed protein product [Brachionus calyciflorus]
MEHQINTSNNNDEESIFLTSSDDDKDHESIDRDEYLAQEEEFRNERNDYDDDASDNDDYAFGNSYEEEDRSSERRPIKVYDNDDNDDDDSDDDIPLNLYNKNLKLKKLQQQKKQNDSDIEEIPAETSSSTSSEEDEILDQKQESAHKKRGRPKRAEDNKNAKKLKNIRKLPTKQENIKKFAAKKTIRKNSDSSSSTSSVESDNKQVKKPTTKEIVNTESSNKTLVKKQSLSTTTSNQTQNKPISKLAQAQNIISGRVINFESGFKIPKRPSNESNLDKEPPEKKSKTDEKQIIEKPKIPSKDTKETVKQKPVVQQDSKPVKPVSTSSTSKPVITPSTEKKVEKKPHTVKNGFKESMDFLSALNSSSSRKHSHVVKKTPSTTSTSTVTTSTPKVETSKSELSQDKTIETTSLNNNLETTLSSSTLINRVDNVENIQLSSEHSIANTLSYSDSNLLKLNSDGLKSNLTIPGSSKKLSKKKVVWAEELENVQFFYLDESERVIKKEAYRGADMSKVDKLSEKEFTFRLTSGHGFGDYNVNEENTSTWPANGLIKIDLPETTIIPEIKSEEREIQAKREATTLAVLVFKKFMPDSASEPDPEINPPEIIRTKIIPLDDTNLNSSVLSDSSFVQNEENNEKEKFYNPIQEQKISKAPLLSNPVSKAPLLPTPPVPTVTTPTESIESKKTAESPNILNLLNLSNLSNSLLRSPEDTEKIKKILCLVETKKEETPIAKSDDLPSSDTSNKTLNIPNTDTNNNPKWNNNNNNNSNNNGNSSSSWYNNNNNNREKFNNNKNYSNSGNQNYNNSGRNVFVNNFKRGVGNNRPSNERLSNTGSYRNNDNYNNNNYRGGSDSRSGYNRQGYNNYNQNRSRFGENNKKYEDSSSDNNKNDSKSTQGGRWI